mmetsp:Transcript_5303/g.7280  ORF Transcript_5303/g.7280 Transcript_5303/m.7280 type:complete len:399 (-) Transcript_5303:125-1321(-)
MNPRMGDQLLPQSTQSKSRGSIVLSSLIIGTSLIIASYLLTNQCSEVFKNQPDSVGMSVVSSPDSTHSSLHKHKNGKPSETGAKTDVQANVHTAAQTDPDPNAPWPRIAWLMSFPNSGTSYTMMMTQRLSDRTAASNYGAECQLDEKDNLVPVHADHPDGPCLLQPLKRKLPDRYIITKTHCTGYGTIQPPDKRVNTRRTFLLGCLRGNHNGIDMHYDEKLVQRAIHLIRDPFNNIVSRFHLQQHAHTKKGDNNWLKKYPSTPEGFQNWCTFMNNSNKNEENDSRFIDDDLRNAQKGVPCFAEFFEYAQWHQLALDTTRDLKIPTLVMHYENFETDHNRTIKKIFDFLELEPEGEEKEFIAGKSYDEYFTKTQRAKAMNLIKEFVNPDTWELLERYDV